MKMSYIITEKYRQLLAAGDRMDVSAIDPNERSYLRRNEPRLLLMLEGIEFRAASIDKKTKVAAYRP
jgi:hypothetical protein